MRVRFFSYFYPPCIGGGEVILQHQAEELARRGHEVHVHTTPYSNIACTEQVSVGSSVENGVHVHRHRSFLLPFHNPLEKDAVTPAFLKEVMAPADLLVCVGYPSFHLEWLQLRFRTPLIVQNYITSDFLQEILGGQGGLNKKIRSAYWRHYVRPLLSRADRVVADSPGAAEALRRHLGLKNVSTHIGMAVDPLEFASITEEDRAEARKYVGPGRYLLAPSRISRQKGADWLIRAAGPLLNDDLKLVICGPVNENDFFERVKELARPYGDRIVITQMPRRPFVALIAGASVLCLPSRGETVGGVVFEGMFAGVPVVVSEGVEAAREEYLHPGENGWMVPVEDEEALRKALVEALDAPPSVVGAARKMVKERYTWESSVDRLEKLFLEVCGA